MSSPQEPSGELYYHLSLGKGLSSPQHRGPPGTRGWDKRRQESWAGVNGRHRPALVHTQCPCSDWLVISGHQPRDLIKLVMNPNMSLGSQELSLVSSACRLILVFASFFPPPLPPSPSSSQGIKKKPYYYHFPHCWHGNTGICY